jgi:hypothetical protein
MPVEKVCVVCNSKFSVPPVREKTAMFCGKECKAKHASAKYLAERYECECQWCKKKFSVPLCRKDSAKFCSNKCRNESMVGVAFTDLKGDGTEVIHADGYILERAKYHPFNVGGYVMQHRLVMEREMRNKCSGHHFLIEVDGIEYLKRGIEVHHVNEVKHENDLSNLIACTSAGHKDLHAGRIPMLSECWPIPKETRQDEERYKQLICEKCGNGFRVKLSTWKIRGAKYCSIACSNKYDGDLPSVVYKACDTCGREYSMRRSEFLRGRKYCSKGCKDKSYRLKN